MLAADMFGKDCPSDLGIEPSFRVPTPLAVVAEGGEIFVAQFDGTSYGSGETFLTPFAVVSGAQSVAGHTGYLLTWAPSGDVLLIYDGDCARMGSVGLAPLSALHVDPWTTATQATGTETNAPALYRGTADTRIYR